MSSLPTMNFLFLWTKIEFYEIRIKHSYCSSVLLMDQGMSFNNPPCCRVLVLISPVCPFVVVVELLFLGTLFLATGWTEKLTMSAGCVCVLFFFPQVEVCSGTVAEVIQSVVNGADGCIFCFGQVKLGKLLHWQEIRREPLLARESPHWSLLATLNVHNQV